MTGRVSEQSACRVACEEKKNKKGPMRNKKKMRLSCLSLLVKFFPTRSYNNRSLSNKKKESATRGSSAALPALTHLSVFLSLLSFVAGLFAPLLPPSPFSSPLSSAPPLRLQLVLQLVVGERKVLLQPVAPPGRGVVVDDVVVEVDEGAPLELSAGGPGLLVPLEPGAVRLVVPP